MPRLSIDLSDEDLAFLRDMAQAEGYRDAETYLGEQFTKFFTKEFFEYYEIGPVYWIDDPEWEDEELFERIGEELYLDPGGGVRHEDEIRPHCGEMDDDIPF